MFNFYTHALASVQGSLTKIWLAAHWKQKVTKDHVFECNLERTIGDIISPQMQIGLRTSGYLLLGVVRIFSRKAKYLLADCTHALVKIKVAFRPDETQMPVEGLEATVKKITLREDFTSFNDQLPHSNDIDVDLNSFSLNQSRPDEITLKEDFGNAFLNLTDIGDESQCFQDCQLDISFRNNDSFGDEGTGLDLLDFLTNDSDCAIFTDISPETPQNDNPENTSLNDQHGADRGDPAEEEYPSPLANEQATFALAPVLATSSAKKKSGKRKCRLIVDRMTMLTNKAMQKQLSDYSNLVVPMDMAPPTRQVMLWKEGGAAVKLLAQLCTNVIAPEIKETFKKSVYLVVHTYNAFDDVEVMRQDDHEAHRNLSTLNTESLEDPSRDHKLTDTHYSSYNQTDLELTQDEHRLDFSHPDLPSEHSIFVHPSHLEQNNQSLMGSQDLEAQRVNRQAQKFLKSLQRTSDTRFSLKDLCARSTRSQAASIFYFLLVLKKQQSVDLQQSAPFEDIFVTPGPTFFS
ncbi:double-strand-break repair protein rad21-like protein 1 [Dunckerocampus dactyliophorus]|uniref:double-strand-break repair protein rad21-like protein 1 n=1 Tax=Dunckerocampus dactyliophorus TaxID=161453 RepID=UPI0024050F26|nr:double-strand-break repair protein rad21-like protein 1 [Dunckerocampus dactyliophorus]